MEARGGATTDGAAGRQRTRAGDEEREDASMEGLRVRARAGSERGKAADGVVRRDREERREGAHPGCRGTPARLGEAD